MKWKKFEFDGRLDEGLYWFALESPEYTVDVDDYGNAIGAPTGNTKTRVILGELSWNDTGRGDGNPEPVPHISAVDWSEDRPVDDEEVATHYAVIEKPERPQQDESIKEQSE